MTDNRTFGVLLAEAMNETARYKIELVVPRLLRELLQKRRAGGLFTMRWPEPEKERSDESTVRDVQKLEGAGRDGGAT